MQVHLTPHPDHPPRAIRDVTVDMERNREGQLSLWYMVFGDLNELWLPQVSEGARVDGLWRTTCFELFIREPEGNGYVEFNFSPSSDWAAYTFDSYRAGASNLELSGAPIISGCTFEGWYELHVTPPSEVRAFANLVNLTAVIEERDGTKSYWALSHPPEGPPDFHHPACFTLELPPSA